MNSTSAPSDHLIIPPDNEGSLLARSQTTPYTEMLWKNDHNLDESLAGNAPLPRFTSRSVKEWEEEERPRLLQQFKDLMYGEMPPGPDHLRTELLAEKDDALDGAAVRKEIRIHCEMNSGKRWYFDMLLYVPRHVSRPPVFVGLNFDGNQFYSPEPDVRMTRSTWIDYRNGWAIRPYEKRCGNLESWNFAEAVSRGYAVATAAYGEIAPDHLNGLQNSVFTLFYDPQELRSDYQVPFAEHKSGSFRRPVSMIGAWAWGLSRMLDALEQEPLVDAGRAAVIGHSRLGKTALWAGANDPRFKLVISNNSGCAGAAPSRRRFGESLRILYWEQRPWLSPAIVRYIDRPETLPIDQHQLLALAAPRNLYVASATEDLNADPKGEFISAAAASEIWRLHGLTGLGTDQMPEPDRSIGKELGYHLRTGRHAIKYWDWRQYYDFADRCFHK